jgi:hypothetical protein
MCVDYMIHNLSQIAHNGRQFMLKTTDQKNIQVVLSQPVRKLFEIHLQHKSKLCIKCSCQIGEHLEGLVQVRGMFDGQRIQAESYNLLLPEISSDFGECELLKNYMKFSFTVFFL